MVRFAKKFIAFFNIVRKTDIVKVFSFTAISTFIRMLTGFISLKVVAVIVGPSGIALLGQLNNFISIILTVATGGISNGITKYIAESKESVGVIKGLLSTALKITLWCSFSCGILLILFSQILSKIILLSPNYKYVFIIFGLTLFLYALNTLVASILNGYKEFELFVKVNILGSILGLIFTLILVIFIGLAGALIAAVTFQSIMFLVSLFMIRKLHWVSKSYFNEKFDRLIAKKYLKYTLMTFATVATAPVSQLILRSYVISNISSLEAGWWEAMNRISGVYLMIITASFGVYYLPRLSELKLNMDLKYEILKAYKLIIPVLILGFTLIYFSRFIIIKTLFTKDFLMMENLFVWQLVGDLFKICSWLLAFLMVAKAMAKVFIFTEIFFSINFILISFYFMKLNGVIGINQAYALNYFLYFIFLVIMFRKLLYGRHD